VALKQIMYKIHRDFTPTSISCT